MTRPFFAVTLIGLAGLALAPGLIQGCGQTGVGDPCTPEQEYDPTFLGFAAGEVNVESKSFDCQTRLCLANHFQGRVTCPYGQTKTGTPTAVQAGGNAYTDKNGNPIGACVLPGGGVNSPTGVAPSINIDGTNVSQAVTGSASDTTDGAQVLPWCLGSANADGVHSTDRSASNTVYCSCRCANVNGQTNDGANYCSCPQGYACQQLVTPIGTQDTGLTGAYCIKQGSVYDALNSCTAAGGHCDPSNSATYNACGTFNGQQ